MRKTEIVTITAEGRDKGKQFHITEMSAFKAERWATKAFLALARSGVDIPDNVSSAGIAGLAILGLRALSGIHNEDAFELMDEMMGCVSIIRNQNQPDVIAPLMETDIEEVATLVYLRSRVFELHTGFSFADGKLTSESAATTQSAA